MTSPSSARSTGAGARRIRHAHSHGRRGASGRKTRQAQVPVISVYIRQEGVEVDRSARAHIRRKLRTKLAKFAASVERASVRIADLNGPRGGIDRVCRIKVVLRGLPSVVFEQRGATLEAVVNGALTGVERTVRRSVQRRRMAPIKGKRRARGRGSRPARARSPGGPMPPR
jgi:hypothetical protein